MSTGRHRSLAPQNSRIWQAVDITFLALSGLPPEVGCVFLGCMWVQWGLALSHALSAAMRCLFSAEAGMGVSLCQKCLFCPLLSRAGQAMEIV